MKKIFLLLVAGAFINSAGAQISLDYNDFYAMTNALIIYGVDSAIVDPGSAGAIQVWDYSTLQPANLDTSLMYKDVFPANPLFPTANLSVTMPLMPGSSDSLRFYYELDQTGFYTDGFFGQYSFPGVVSTQQAVFIPRRRVFPFPLSYGTLDSSANRQEQLQYLSPTAGNDSLRRIRHRNYHLGCDGWGTLKTPYGTYNALRIWNVVNEVDTTFGQDANGNWVIDDTGVTYGDTSYQWFTTGTGWLGNMDRLQSGKYRYKFIHTYQSPTNIESANGVDQSWLYPNPAKDMVHIDAKKPLVSLLILNQNGQVVARTEMPSSSISVAALSPGLYLFLGLTMDGKILRQSLIRQD